jgi:endonuclease G
VATAYLLDDTQMKTLLDAAVEAGLANPMVRTELLRKVNQKFVVMQLGGGLLNPGMQLRSDLQIMNRIERLADGRVPLLDWLSSAEEMTSELEQGKVFSDAIVDVSRRASGEPPPPSAERLPGIRERIIHQDDTVPVGFLAAGELAGRSVAKLQVTRYEDGRVVTKPNGDPRRDLGTGWVLAERLLVTNHHVVAARGDDDPAPSAPDLERQAAATVALFDYDAEGAAGNEVAFDGLVASDPELDYAVLRSAAPAARSAAGARARPARRHRRRLRGRKHHSAPRRAGQAGGHPQQPS